MGDIVEPLSSPSTERYPLFRPGMGESTGGVGSPGAGGRWGFLFSISSLAESATRQRRNDQAVQPVELHRLRRFNDLHRSFVDSFC